MAGHLGRRIENRAEDVEQLVAQRIADLAPGGGYIVSSGNSVAEFIPLDNYRAMLQAGHECGKYPFF